MWRFSYRFLTFIIRRLTSQCKKKVCWVKSAYHASDQASVSCHDDDDAELHVLGYRVDILETNCDQCLSMVQCSTKTVRLIRTESPGRPPRLSHSS